MDTSGGWPNVHGRARQSQHFNGIQLHSSNAIWYILTLFWLKSPALGATKTHQPCLICPKRQDGGRGSNQLREKKESSFEIMFHEISVCMLIVQTKLAAIWFPILIDFWLAGVRFSSGLGAACGQGATSQRFPVPPFDLSNVFIIFHLTIPTFPKDLNC